MVVFWVQFGGIKKWDWLILELKNSVQKWKLTKYYLKYNIIKGGKAQKICFMGSNFDNIVSVGFSKD